MGISVNYDNNAGLNYRGGMRGERAESLHHARTDTLPLVPQRERRGAGEINTMRGSQFGEVSVLKLLG